VGLSARHHHQIRLLYRQTYGEEKVGKGRIGIDRDRSG
jgi:hypothetical protein